MRLEGSLDAFGLPDVLQLLGATGKSGVLRLVRDGSHHAAIGLREGYLTTASHDCAADALAPRLVGAGLVDDDSLGSALTAFRAGHARSVVRALLDAGAVGIGQVQPLAAAQVVDDLGELLRWATGEFSFAGDDPDPDALGIRLDLAGVVAEGQRRLGLWPQLGQWVSGTGSLPFLAVRPAEDPSCTRGEWAVLALVDGARSAVEIARLLGRGEFDVSATLAGLLSRGLLAVGDGVAGGGGNTRGGGVAELVRRQAMLAGTAPGSESSAQPGQPAPSTPLEPAAAPAEALAVPLDVVPAPLPDSPVTRSLVLRLIPAARGL